MREIKISEIKGIKIGHAQNVEGGTGCTAIICEDGAVAGVDVRGGGPASRETELLKPVNMVQQIHCVMLSGGSAYGLAAGDGAMQFLEERGVGFDVGVGVVPIVCGASLFDLVVGDAKCRPDKAMGYEACKTAGKNEPGEGNVGAGTGASIGKFLGPDRMMKSGLGTYAVQLGEVQCGAIVAVNALGDVIDYDTGKQIAGILSEDKTSLASTEDIMYKEIGMQRNVFSGNTTIGCIITNAILTKNQANKLASIAHNGYAKTISPVHTSADGDTIFVMSTGEVEVSPDALGALATEVMARAICSGVKAAECAYGLKAAKDFLKI
ncbi:P1 family peptidase [Anaerotignum sp.]|uniref:P1 family peptidase n=1 Tax=Anaerotignum sp. TaxID=2039241 RepID=UPI00331D29CC